MENIKMDIDCDNSPKKKFLKQFNTAFANGNMAFLTEAVTDDIRWVMIGTKTIEGKDDFVAALERMKDDMVKEMIIDKIITHGKEGAANGVMKMENGKNYAFSDVYVFSSAKGTAIKTITSYVIEV